MSFIVEDEVVVPDYDAVHYADKRLGQDGLVQANVRKLPMYRLMYHLLGINRFAYHLHDHTDHLMSLHEQMVRKDKELYKIAVQAPAEMFIGPARNLAAEMIGPRLFQEHYLPLMDLFADLAHEEGKLSGAHMDASFGFMRELLIDAHLDVIEAFTPAPVCDMTVAEAREVWPDKVLWVNFTSSFHIEELSEIRQETIKILQEAAPGDRFLLGITEDVPADVWENSFLTISESMLSYGHFPIVFPRRPPGK